MFLKIYLGVSVFCFIMMMLTSFSLLHMIKAKYEDKLEECDTDISGLVIVYVRMLVVSFIPLLNIILLITMIFFSNKISEKVNNSVKKTIKEKDEQ